MMSGRLLDLDERGFVEFSKECGLLDELYGKTPANSSNLPNYG